MIEFKNDKEKSAYEEGKIMAEKYRALGMNPYFPCDPCHNMWVRGWLEQHDKQKEIEKISNLKLESSNVITFKKGDR